MKKRTAAWIVSCAMAFSAMFMTGAVFAEDTASTVSSAAEAAEGEAAEQGTIGEKQTDGDYLLTVKNATGLEIKSVALSIDAEEFAELPLSGESFKDGETRTLYCTPKTKNADGSDVTKPPVYDLKVTFADDKEATLHTLPFGDAESVELRFEDPVAYIVFRSLSRNEEFDTLVSEKVKNGLMTSEEAFGSADDGYGGDDYDDYDYDDYDYDDYGGGGGDDACLDDAILY